MNISIAICDDSEEFIAFVLEVLSSYNWRVMEYNVQCYTSGEGLIGDIKKSSVFGIIILGIELSAEYTYCAKGIENTVNLQDATHIESFLRVISNYIVSIPPGNVTVNNVNINISEKYKHTFRVGHAHLVVYEF